METADTRSSLDPILARDAFRQVLSDPGNTRLLEGVRYAFDYRAGLRHMPEAKRGGLRFALARALSQYAFPPDKTPEPYERYPLDPSFRKRLRRAATSLAADPANLEGYKNTVAFKRGDVSALTVDQVAADFKQALTNYSADRVAGTSIDPW